MSRELPTRTTRVSQGRVVSSKIAGGRHRSGRSGGGGFRIGVARRHNSRRRQRNQQNLGMVIRAYNGLYYLVTEDDDDDEEAGEEEAGEEEEGRHVGEEGDRREVLEEGEDQGMDDMQTDTSHHTQTTQWVPPQESWKSDNGLPYGWESAVDNNGKQYYINHVEQTTSPVPPGKDAPVEELEAPEAREVQLLRDQQMGFGFVAGSEKPVIVRFVTEGGPSEGQLLPGDQIVKINEEDVEKAPREHVIELVRSCHHSITLTVCQPHLDNSSRKSALLTAAKKARLKSHPARVRFAESVIVNGASVITPSTNESYIPFMPNVLKVFLENGQTKSFKYDSKTTVKDVVHALQEKLSLSCGEHFALVLQNMKSPTHGRMLLLQDSEALAEIAAKPESQHFKCLFRVAFVPRDAYQLLQKDHTAFEYFYMQCCNDVVQERFASELKYDVALRLAALHIHQHCYSNNNGKVSLKQLERDTGLERFVPRSLLQNLRPKELRKMLAHYMKANQKLAPTQAPLTALQATLHYLKIVSELRSFGGKCFVATLVEQRSEAMIVVGPKQGISVVTNIKTNSLQTLANYEDLDHIVVSRESESMQRVELHLKEQHLPQWTLSMLSDDVHDLIALVEGYFRLFVDKDKNLLRSNEKKTSPQEEVPPYSGPHRVVASAWSYTNSSSTSPSTSSSSADEEISDSHSNQEAEQNQRNRLERVVDLSQGPPPYTEKPQIIERLAEGDASTRETETPKPQTKPNALQVNGGSSGAGLPGSVAPLASPDVSTISGSSESSLGVSDSVADLGDAIVQRDCECASIGSGELNDADLALDSDSITGSSVSTVISRTSNGSQGDAASSPAARGPMSRSASGQDSRFGVSSFRTFATTHSPPPTRSKSHQAWLESSTEFMGVDGEKEDETTAAAAGQGDGERDGNDSPTPRESHQGHLESTDSMDTESTVSESVTADSVSLSERQDSVEEGARQSDSEDTDSASTPTHSPAHARLATVTATPGGGKKDAERPQSFGLRSPDKLPSSEEGFEQLACSFGLHSPDNAPQESIHPSYNPQLFSDGALYLDPDIIDLTLIPPPKTPDQEQLIDFSSPTLSMATPPPGFETSHLPGAAAREGHVWEMDMPPALDELPPHIREKIDSMIQNDEDLSTQMGVMDALLIDQRLKDCEKESGIESESDSGNETISSENVEPSSSGVHDYLPITSLPKDVTRPVGVVYPGVSMAESSHPTMSFDTDIDAFIASMTVPPPPQSTPPKGESVLSVEGKVRNWDKGKTFDPSVFASHGLEPNALLSSLNLEMPTEEIGSWEDLISNKHMPGPVLEDEFAQWVIPPPPSSSTSVLQHIPIVPPVDMMSPDNDRTFVESIVGNTNTSAQHLPAPGAPHRSSPADSPTKTKPHVPPKRFGSHDSDDATSPVSVTSPSSLPGNSPVSHQGAPWLHPNTRSADSSPLHKVHELYKHSRVHNSMGTLPRIRTDNRRKAPPPPPPRVSSMSLGDDYRRHSACSDTALSPASPSRQFSAPGGLPIPPNYENVFEPAESHSEPQVTATLRRQGGSSVSLSQEAMSRAQQDLEAARASLISTLSANFEKDKEDSDEQSLDASQPENLPFTPLDYRRTSSSSSTDSTKSGSSDSKFQAFKSKLKTYVSPSIHKRQIMLTAKGGNKERKLSLTDLPDSDLGIKKNEYLRNASPSCSANTSPRVGRSSTFSTHSKSSSSPRGSPLVTRHSSFATDRQGSQSPRTFRTFLGEQASGSESGSETSPSSPLRTAGIRTSIPVASKASGEVSENGSKTIPLTVVHPIVPRSPGATRHPPGSPHTRPPGGPSRRHSSSSQGGATDLSSRIPPWRHGISSASASPAKDPMSTFRRPPPPKSTATQSESEETNMNHNGMSATNGAQNGEHVSIPTQVLEKTYSGEQAFKDAEVDVGRMVESVNRAIVSLSSPGQSKDVQSFKQYKDALVADSRQFVTDSKMLVSSATLSMDRLIQHVSSSMHTLARIVSGTCHILPTIIAESQACNLAFKVKDIANAYKATVMAADAAAGRPLSDPNMKMLMKQATALAAVLSTYMKTLKVLENT